jgi:hypothetical protein
LKNKEFFVSTCLSCESWASADELQPFDEGARNSMAV